MIERLSKPDRVDLPGGVIEEEAQKIVSSWKDRARRWGERHGGARNGGATAAELEAETLDFGTFFLRGYARLLRAIGKNRKHAIIREAIYLLTKEKLVAWRKELEPYESGKAKRVKWNTDFGPVLDDDQWLPAQILLRDTALRDLDIQHGKLLDTSAIQPLKNGE